MWKKILIIASAVVAALIGTVSLVKNSKKMKTRRTVRRVSNTMYNVGTVLRTLSCQVAQS